MNKLFLFITLAIIVIFIFITIIISLITPQKQKINITPSPIPSIEINESNNTNRTEKLKIAESSHSREEFYNLSIISPFTLIFSKPIDPSTIDFEILPKVEIETELDSTQTKLTFKPKNIWEPNIIYSLNIKKAKAQDKSNINATYQINFRAESTYDEENSSYVELFNKK